MRRTILLLFALTCIGLAVYWSESIIVALIAGSLALLVYLSTAVDTIATNKEDDE